MNPKIFILAKLFANDFKDKLITLWVEDDDTFHFEPKNNKEAFSIQYDEKLKYQDYKKTIIGILSADECCICYKTNITTFATCQKCYNNWCCDCNRFINKCPHCRVRFKN